MEIEFTEYVLPNGRQEHRMLHTSDEVSSQVNEILETERYRFECEVLTSGHASVTCFDTEEEEDIAIELCKNGPEIEAAIGKMVLDAHSFIFPQ